MPLETQNSPLELPVDLHDKIKQLKALFEAAQMQVLKENDTIDAIKAAEGFEQKNRSKIESLKKQFAEYPVVIGLCEEFARFFLDVGEMHFRHDKNATTTVDRMYDCAAKTLDGVNYSEETKNLLYDAYFSWHWHGH